MSSWIARIKPSEPAGIMLTVAFCLIGTFLCSYFGSWKLEIVVASFGAFGQLAIAGGAYLVTRGQLLQSKSDADREEYRHNDAMKAEADRFQRALEEEAQRHRSDLAESKAREDEKDRRIEMLESGREKGQLLAKINLLDALCEIVFRSVRRKMPVSLRTVDKIIEIATDLASRRRFAGATVELQALWQMAERFSVEGDLPNHFAFNSIRKECNAKLCAANGITN